jgi:hypothetical protein
MISLSDQQAEQVCGGASLVNVNVPVVTSISLGTNVAQSLALSFGGPATSTVNQANTLNVFQTVRSRLG